MDLFLTGCANYADCSDFYAQRKHLVITIGVKRATPNWAVLSEYGHVPLQLYWIKSANLN
eukprot:1149407-Pelagomonas_calceolata.AAC.2